MFRADSTPRYRRDSSLNTEHRRLSIASFVQPESLISELSTDKVTLKRELGLFSGVSFIIGIIIGSGIFISPKGVLKETQSVGLSLVVWAFCGLISILGALCFAEIGALIPRNGAEAAYIKEGIGSIHERIGDILAYLFVWTIVFIAKPASAAVISLTFSQYFLSGVFNDCAPSEDVVKLLAILMILILINVNSLSTSVANRLNIIFVICKILTLVTVIIVGLIRIGQGYTENLKNGFVGTTKQPSSIALGLYKGLFAYGGWTALNTVTEELKNPKRNLWLSIVLALPTVIILYILANISYLTAMTKEELLESNAVAVTWATVALKPAVRALPILISISALGSVNVVLYSAARYCMVGAQYGYLPEIFSYIQIQRRTPLAGVFFQGFIAIMYCIPSNIYGLMDLFSFATWIFYGLTFVATICCKFTKKDQERIIYVPIPLVIVIILVSVYLVIAPIIFSPNFGILGALGFILFGLVFYYPFVYRKAELRLISKR